MSSRLARLLATGAGAGHLPVAPGTCGSLEAVILAVILWFVVPDQARVILAVLTAAAAVAGVWAAGVLARRLGTEDPSQVVIDEIAGQWLALLFVTWSPLSLTAGFFLFRLFDIVKPFPARWSERLPGGWGIVADDLIAGLYAALSLWGLGWVTQGTLGF